MQAANLISAIALVGAFGLTPARATCPKPLTRTRVKRRPTIDGVIEAAEWHDAQSSRVRSGHGPGRSARDREASL